MAKTYAEKLRDPRWQKMRLEVMERDGFACRTCKNGDKTLNVHHAYYTKGADPWEYPIAHLVTLCEDCHQVAEKRREMLLRLTIDFKPQHQVLAFALGLTNHVAPSIPEMGAACAAFANLIKEVFDSRTASETADFDGALISLQSMLFGLRDALAAEKTTNQTNEEEDEIPT